MTEVLQHAIDVVTLGSLYAILGLSIALIFGIMRLVNFAQGELVMVGAYAAVLLGDAPWVVGLLIMITVPVIFAVLMERVAFRPVRGAPETTMLLTSFAVSYLLQNIALIAFGSAPRGIDIAPSLSTSFEVGDLVIPKLAVATAGATAVILGGLTLFLARTSLGLHMRAAAEDFTMARILGIRANRVIVCAFALSGVVAGVASYLILAQTGSAFPAMGLNAILVAFIATVLGGLGSLWGAVLGGYALGLTIVLLDVALPASMRSYREAFAFTVVIVVLLWRPQGLVRPRTSVERI